MYSVKRAEVAAMAAHDRGGFASKEVAPSGTSISFLN